MKNFLTFLCFIITTSIYSQSDVDQLTILLHQFMVGASNNDKETHQNFWAEDLIYTSSAGKRFGKAQIMKGFDDAQTETVGPKSVYTAEDIQINVYDDMAVVAFKMKGQTGDNVQYYYNSGTFLKREKRWQVVNWQATMIPAEN
jgi:ketosteroid isomerase-like protein